VHDDHMSTQDGESADAAASVAQSRKAAERIWAEIGRLLTDSRSGRGWPKPAAS